MNKHHQKNIAAILLSNIIDIFGEFIMKSKLTSGASIFHIMTELSNKHGAINLSQGFPGFNPDPSLLNLVSEFIKGEYNQFAPMSGIPELRNNIAIKINKYSGRSVHPEKEVTVSDGATEA